MNWHSVLFLIFSMTACGFGAMMVLSSNVVRMAFYLVLSLSATSGLFFLAGADFVGAMQLMIYVGGTLVLLVFGVMLTAQERFVQMRTSFPEMALAACVGAAMLVLLTSAAMGVPAWRGDPPAAVSVEEPPRTVGPLAMALLGLRVDPSDDGDPHAGYLLPFEIVSVHLLVVLVGAAYLARTRYGADSLARRPPGDYDADHVEDNTPATPADDPNNWGTGA